MKKNITFLCLLLVGNSFAFKPTANSLFKNLNNMDISENTTIITYSINKISSTGSQYYFNKFYFEQDNLTNGNVCQLNYAGGILNSSNVDEINCFRKKNLLDNTTKLQSIFYSVIAMFAQNSSDLMLKFLKKNGSEIKSNEELINQTQNFYLYQYKGYLKAKSEGSEEVENPLVTEDYDKNEKIKKVLSESYLREDNLVKRVKNGNNFYWKVEDSVVSATFNNDKNELVKMTLNIDEEVYELVFKNYLLMSSSFKHPETIEIKTPQAITYEIKAKSVQVIEDNSTAYSKRITSLKKKMLKEVESPLKVELVK